LTFESGNACHATLELTPPSGLTVSFTWKSALSDDDQDRYFCESLPQVLRRAVHEVDLLANSMAACLHLKSKGLLERAGVDEDGLPAWIGTEKAQAMSTDSENSKLTRFLSKVRGIRALDWLRGLLPNA
jgi:hypothetical protein